MATTLWVTASRLGSTGSFAPLPRPEGLDSRYTYETEQATVGFIVSQPVHAMHQHHLWRDVPTGCIAALLGQVYYCGPLRAALSAPSAISPAELSTRAFLRWGTDAFNRIEGDYLLAIWDPRQRELFCAGDTSGTLGAVFAIDEATVLLSSSLPVLLTVQPTRRPNYGMIGEALAVGVVTQSETLYHDIHRLPPASLLHVTAQRWHLNRYWDTPARPTLHAATLEGCQEEFTEILSSAIRERVVGHPDVGVMLSGGLDSSLIAALAAIEKPVPPRPTITGFSLRGPGEDWDEGPHLEALTRSIGLRRFDWFAQHPYEWPNWDSQARATGTVPDFPPMALLARLYDLAAANRVGLLLSGEGGDNLFMCGRAGYVHYLMHRRYAELRALWRLQRAARGGRFALGQLGRSVAWFASPPHVRGLLRRCRANRVAFPLLNPRFVADVHLRDRVASQLGSERFAFLDIAQRYQANNAALPSLVFQSLRRLAENSGIIWRAPLLDRRLVEFAYKMPLHYLQSPDQDRLFHRRALGSLLPTTDWHRSGKAFFGSVYAHALRTPAVLDGLRDTCRREWVNGPALARRIDALHQSPPTEGPSDCVELWMLFAVETWYRGAFGTWRSSEA